MNRNAIMDPLLTGKSKIPKLDSLYHGVPGERPKNGISANLSRLELMQVNYQKQLEQQKEERIIQIYEENQRKTLWRVNSVNNKPGGGNFFQQPRNIENGNVYIMPLVNINCHQKFKPVQTSGAWTGEKPPIYRQHNSQNQHIDWVNKKMSAGRDRSNPLAPIERKNSTDIDISHWDNEIQRRQREIMAQIAVKQAELKRLQQERQEEEEEERRERKKWKKREAERKRQHKLDEMRRKKEEEERERREEEEELARIVQKQLREERARETQAREAQIKLPVQLHLDQNNGYRDRMSPNIYQRDPVPPSTPKPANNYQARKKESAVCNVNQTSLVSMDTFDNTASPPPSFDLQVFEQAAQQEGAYDNSVRLEPCSKCGRKFASDRLQRHLNSCDNLTKKRKVMDPRKMRVGGTDFEKYNTSGAFRQKTPPKKSSNWKAKHESFINNIRYARKAKAAEMNGTLADLPPPPPEENPDYIQCSYCNRKFNPTVAERHIPKCKDVKSRPAPVKRRL